MASFPDSPHLLILHNPDPYAIWLLQSLGEIRAQRRLSLLCMPEMYRGGYQDRRLGRDKKGLVTTGDFWGPQYSDNIPCAHGGGDHWVQLWSWKGDHSQFIWYIMPRFGILQGKPAHTSSLWAQHLQEHFRALNSLHCIYLLLKWRRRENKK